MTTPDPIPGWLIQDMFVSFGWDIVIRPLYSPDLVSSDYHIIDKPKSFRVDNDLEMTRRFRKLLKNGFWSGGYPTRVYKCFINVLTSMAIM